MSTADTASSGFDKSRRSLEALGARYRQNPNDGDAAIAYARDIRANGQRAQAVAVLEQASIRNPTSMPLLGAYGRALADAGQYQQSLMTLERAHTPDNPDWRILNVQGAVLDQMGRHAEAQRHYASALKIMPNEASVLSNLGLSYMLTKDLKNAETTLRRAAAQPNAGPKVRQISRSSSACSAVLTKQRRLRVRTCRKAKRRRTSPICGRCLRKRVTGRN